MKTLIVLIGFVFLVNKLHGAQVKWEFFFETNKHSLTVLEQKRVDEFIIIMSKLNIDSIEVIGFADEDGEDKANFVLSQKRTLEIIKNLNLNDSVQLKSGWFGENFKGYIYDSTLKHLNRRVKVVVWHSGKKYPPVYFNGVRLKKGDNLSLPAVRFVPGKSIMLPGGEQKLDEIADILIKNPTVKFLIEGHVCCYHEVELSENRARTVYCYLIEKGIEEHRLTYFGYGTSKLAYTINDARNRRVALTVLDV